MTYIILKAKSLVDIGHYDLLIVVRDCESRYGPYEANEWPYHCVKIIARFKTEKQAAAYVKAFSLFGNTKYDLFYNNDRYKLFIQSKAPGRRTTKQIWLALPKVSAYTRK